MPAGTHNITIEQGADFQLEVAWTDDNDDPIDLTGATVTAQVRRAYDSAATLLDFDVTTDDVLGLITLSAAADDTEVAGAGVWDIRIEQDDGTVSRLLRGSVQFKREVTHE